MGVAEEIKNAFSDLLFRWFNDADTSKEVKVDLASATTAKATTLKFKQTEDRQLDFPDKDGELETVNAERSALAALTLDFSKDEIKTLNMTIDATLQIDNPLQGKVAVLEVMPNNFVLTLPPSVKVISGKFRKTVKNWIYLHCIDGATPVYLATINQEV